LAIIPKQRSIRPLQWPSPDKFERQYMKQQELDLIIDHDQPLIGFVEFYESNPAVQEVLTYRKLLKLIKANRAFFGDSVVTISSKTFLRKSFLERIYEWLAIKNPNNLPRAA
jgi:hypothetical protein